MSLALLFHRLLLNMFRMLVHPSSGACDLLWIYFMCCMCGLSLFNYQDDLCLYNQLFALYHYVFKFLTPQNFKTITLVKTMF